MRRYYKHAPTYKPKGDTYETRNDIEGTEISGKLITNIINIINLNIAEELIHQ